MSYRSIFVHLDDDEAGDATLDVAASVATSFDAELAGTYLVPGATITPFTSAMLPDAVVQERLAEHGFDQDRAEARFHAAAKRQSVVTARFVAPAGDAIAEAVLHARRADLAVLRQPDPARPEAGFASELAHAVLLASGRAVLFVPHSGTFPTIGTTAIVAWKESREAARAIADALPFLARARKVIVMLMPPRDTSDTEDVAATLSARGVAQYLARHGVTAEVRREIAEDIDVGNLLLSRAADFGVDLIVMGGFSRPRLAERVLGGVTRSLIETMTVPVLMSH